MPKSKKSRRTTAAKSMPAAKPAVTRRGLMKSLPYYAAGAVVVGGGAAWLVTDFRGKLAEGDLTRIGQGNPTIVQIHDTTCPLCQSLQRQTRIALKDCDEGYEYLVANVATAEGLAFQRRMGQPNVTLALLDGDGTPLGFVNGVTPAEELKEIFRRTFS
ncbi:thioredoxin family protein [Octadecabacter sp.]|nr:thioredoxin family protein [Octadecabacter sp.]